MNRLAAKILKNIPSVMSNPRRAWRLLSRRLVPMGVVWTDPDAYQVVGSRTFGRAPRVALTDAFPGIAAVDVCILRAFDRSLETSLSTGAGRHRQVHGRATGAGNRHVRW